MLKLFQEKQYLKKKYERKKKLNLNRKDISIIYLKHL